MKYIILKISLIICAISILVGISIVLICSQNWQEGEIPFNWLEAGLKSCNIEYDEIIPKGNKYEDSQAITYFYEVLEYDDVDTDSVGDIDIWYSNETKYTVYITFELSQNYWNKLYRFGANNMQSCKYSKCLDFDIMIIKR